MANNPEEGSPNIFPALRYKNAPAAVGEFSPLPTLRAQRRPKSARLKPP